MQFFGISDLIQKQSNLIQNTHLFTPALQTNCPSFISAASHLFICYPCPLIMQICRISQSLLSRRTFGFWEDCFRVIFSRLLYPFASPKCDETKMKPFLNTEICPHHIAILNIMSGHVRMNTHDVYFVSNDLMHVSCDVYFMKQNLFVHLYSNYSGSNNSHRRSSGSASSRGFQHRIWTSIQ